MASEDRTQVYTGQAETLPGLEAHHLIRPVPIILKPDIEGSSHLSVHHLVKGIRISHAFHWDEKGRPVCEREWVRLALAESYARLQALKVMNWRLAWELEQGILEPAHASAAKVYSSETVIEIYRLLLEVVGVVGTVEEHSPGAILRGQLEREWRGCQINTFGGGVNEIQREIVAMLGLRLPRVPR